MTDIRKSLNVITQAEHLIENDISNKPMVENMATKLGDLTSVGIGDQNADLYVTRRGSIDAVGKPSKEFNSEAYGITITQPDVLDAQYLYYMLMYLHSSGYWKSIASGSLKLVNIKKDDILNIPLK